MYNPTAYFFRTNYLYVVMAVKLPDFCLMTYLFILVIKIYLNSAYTIILSDMFFFKCVLLCIQ